MSWPNASAFEQRIDEQSREVDQMNKEIGRLSANIRRMQADGGYDSRGTPQHNPRRLEIAEATAQRDELIRKRDQLRKAIDTQLAASVGHKPHYTR